MDYIGKSIFANYFRGIEAVGGKLYFDERVSCSVLTP